nr:MAG TPA: hypothetical protein [Caudoviricetes sp.]
MQFVDSFHVVHFDFLRFLFFWALALAVIIVYTYLAYLSIGLCRFGVYFLEFV